MNILSHRRLNHYSLTLTSAISCFIPWCSYAQTYTTLLPPPSTAVTKTPRQQYLLGLMINGREENQIVPVIFRDGHYILHTADLQNTGIGTSHLPSSPEVDVSSLAGVTAWYDRQHQRIVLTVPLNWLPRQTLQGSVSNGPRYPGRSSNGALFNYDFYTSHTTQSGARLSAWNELRLFGNWGQISSSGVLQQQLSRRNSYDQQEYLRYDTWWEKEDENDALSWRVGDLITNSLTWSNSVRLGGIQFARDFSIRPDLVTWPLPIFSGQAAVPSTVDLFIDGYRTNSNQIQPGPWSMTDMPFVNGAGEAVIVTTDAVGRRVTTTLPFYVSGDLLKQGLSDFSLSIGVIRRNYGLENFSYQHLATSNSYRYGLADWITLENHLEGADRLALAGVGGQIRLGAFGVTNGAITMSHMNSRQGKQYNWGYQYNNRRFSIGTQHVIRQENFGDIALLSIQESLNSGEDYSRYTLSRRSALYNASLSLDHFGSLGLAYIDTTSGLNNRTRLWNLSWGKNLWGNSSLYLSASHDQQRGGWNGAISLIIPLSDLIHSGFSTERYYNKSVQRISISRAMPSDGGFAWDASWANQSNRSDYLQGSLSWRNSKIETSGGYYGDDSYSTTWADLTGSLVIMDGRLFAANQVNDAFVLVKTNYPDVKVRYENQLMGKTDSQGYLLVSRVNSQYAAKYDIDVLDLPADMTTSRVEERFAVRRQSGYLLDFLIKRQHGASVIFHDSHNVPLPLSSQIYRDNQQVEFIGWDGIAWLDDLGENNSLKIVTPDGRSCNTVFHLPDGVPVSLKTYGPVLCQLTSPQDNKAGSSP